MHTFAHRFRRAVLAPLLLLLGTTGAALAADLAPAPEATPVVVSSGWTFRFVPYAWLPALNGTQTIRGRSAKVDASFIDIVEKSDSIVALMGDFEARYGRFALYGDAVWMKLGVDRSHIRSRTPAPGISTTIGLGLNLDIEMAILGFGASYEVARSGPLALDVLGGGRYWYQNADLSFDVGFNADIGDLEIVGARAIAASGSVDWLDPVIGAQLRYTVAPGHELFLRGDIGGFGVGSDFSWQAVGAYSVDFGTYRGVTFSGVLGYRALYVDYTQGEGRRRYEFDMLLHGPILGLSMRF
jgi:hypothetical protein